MGDRFDSKTFEFFVQRSKTWGYSEVLFLYELLLVAVTHFCRVSESGQKPQQLLCLPALSSPSPPLTRLAPRNFFLFPKIYFIHWVAHALLLVVPEVHVTRAMLTIK